MTKSICLQLTKITKVFRTDELETHALRGVNLTIYQGDFVSISGPSGCGKSSLLAIMGLLDTASGGKYIIGNNDVSRLDVDQRAEIRNKSIGFIFQSFNLIDELSVFENVALPLRYREPDEHGKLITEAEITQAVQNALQQVDMAHRTGHKPNQLSGGQQQRVAIARALVGSPAILLVDEPTGNLDSKNGDAVMALLKQLNRAGTTICMVTHDSRYAEFANTRLHLLDGEMVSEHGLEEAC
ncbi:MAG: ABC transporter ATP-binding protein [Gammaproteobacteria bacterium]|nr:ABC transporter ATP-binding protein [Gammaproteobacteria bacterium]MBU2058199.1 ABC transporter ATP-binding protein [Gammaproteobacteria bacterium]MBU2176970.1 ABC transporter ATP-binding protein [Gammaproteobacteria bacterium]MBU2246583.1 ABC transporter ATP-binding protein [Gammaproteobacteria bacterium]MBU2344956.1 ABC transporter ATP-binding protein [Gammaproteobacteria bacterium]